MAGCTGHQRGQAFLFLPADRVTGSDSRYHHHHLISSSAKRAAGRKSPPGSNIGAALLAYAAEVQPEDVAIFMVELSAYFCHPYQRAESRW